MKIFLTSILFTISLSIKAEVFVGTFWEKRTKCPDGPISCIPKAAEKPTSFEFEYPKIGSPTELTITGKDYSVQVYIKYHLDSVDYYSIQFTLLTKSGETVAICSRYEAISTVENVPVGSCGGSHPSKQDWLAGFSVSLPLSE
jgi:hypothetical protein